MLTSLAIVTCVNNEQVFESNLRASRALDIVSEVIVQRGFASAATAYNDALDRASADVCVLIHQDMYLPDGWEMQVISALAWLEASDPEWGVLGMYGVTTDGLERGFVYCTGLRRVLGARFITPIQVRTLDEIVLIVRRASGLRFDPLLPGFHMYGADICMQAEEFGLRNYVVSAFAIHNTEGLNILPVAFWDSYLYMRRKWEPKLPILTPCTSISRSLVRPIFEVLRGIYHYVLRGYRAGKRVADPMTLYRSLGSVVQKDPVG